MTHKDKHRLWRTLTPLKDKGVIVEDDEIHGKFLTEFLKPFEGLFASITGTSSSARVRTSSAISVGGLNVSHRRMYLHPGRQG